MRKRRVLSLLVIVPVLLMVGSIAVTAQESGQRGITGTWMFTVTGDSPAPGVPGPIFVELMTFNDAGGLTETNGILNAHSASNPFVPPALQVNASDGYGTWTHSSSHRFATTFKKLTFAGASTPGALFPGQHLGFATVRESLLLRSERDVDVLSGRFEIEVTDLNGNAVFATGGTVVGTRVPVEPSANSMILH